MSERKRSYDVVIVGGGSAGVSAAIGAAQTGARTLLVERNPYLGGQATHCSLPAYCGFFTQADPPEQIVGGVGQKVIDYLSKMGKCSSPKRSSMGNVIILLDPEAVKLALDLCMMDSGAETLLHTTVIGATVHDEKVTVIECVDDNGRFLIEAQSFVDATGEANLTALANGLTVFGGDGGAVQAGTLMIRIGGVPSDVDISPERFKQAVIKAKADGIGPFSKETGIITRIPGVSDILAILPTEKFNGLEAQSITRAEMSARKQAWAYLKAFKKYLPGFENAYLMQSGPKIGVRETRHVVGEYTLTAEDILKAKRHYDAIARGGWPLEIHREPGAPTEYAWIENHAFYDIPLRALKAKNLKNLWVGGRIVSCDSTAFASLRVMGTAFATGHAAGVAAALTMGRDDYNCKMIQAELIRQEAII